jgi:hypothetical protein
MFRIHRSLKNTAHGGVAPIGNTGLNAPASLIPYYSVHAVGGQLNYILPAKSFSLFFKYEHEYKALSHTLGNTIVLSGKARGTQQEQLIVT